MDHAHLPDLIEASTRRHADFPALSIATPDGSLRSIDYAEMGRRMHAVARALVRHGIGPGDRVAIFAGNSPEWTIADLGILAAAAVTVTVFHTSSPDQVRFVLADSGTRLIFVGSQAEADRLADVRAGLPELREVVALAAGVTGEGGTTLPTLDDLVAEGTALGDDEAATEVSRRLAALGPDDLATLIYTSGTTGEPKGVCLTHGNLLCQLAAIRERFVIPAGERNMSFLPLAHALERGWTLVMLDHGVENVSVADPRTVADAMVQLQPQLFVSVPRLYEKVYAVAQSQAGSGLKRRIFDTSVRIGLEKHRRERAGLPVPSPLRAATTLADRLVLHRVRDAVGGRKTVMASGGAPVRPEVIEFFLAAGLDVYEGYGLTETAPMISCNAPGANRIGSVGRPIPGCEAKIGDQGEILARGGNVFRGYWGRPDLDAEAFTGGWFRTGDIGRIDDEGFLYVTDRLKDLIVTAQGKNVAPGPMEAGLAAHPLIESAVVVGDERPYLVALMQPSFPELEALARERGWPTHDRAALVGRKEVRDLIGKLVADVGAGRAHHEKIQKFRLLHEELSVDAGEVTPTLKVRRSKVAKRYAALIDEMYAEGRDRG